MHHPEQSSRRSSPQVRAVTALAAALACAAVLGLAQQKSTANTPSIAAPAMQAPAAAVLDASRKHQIADDTDRLVQLATQLKAEVDKTSKDTLSLKVIRQAESIEKLAHGVKQQLKTEGN